MRSSHFLCASAILATLSGHALAGTITPGFVDGEYVATNGGTFALADGPLGEVGRELTEEYRYALQFSLGQLPLGATVTSATLSLRDSLGAPNVFVYGSLDVTGAFPDASQGAPLFETTGSKNVVTYDVTSFLQSAVSLDYADFVIRQDPLGAAFAYFDSKQADYFGGGTPHPAVLSITFDEGTAPVTVPEPLTAALLGTAVLSAAFTRRRPR